MVESAALYLGQVAATLFGAPDLGTQIAASPEANQFAGEPNCKILQVMSDGNAFRCLANQVAPPPDGMLEVHFLKSAGVEVLSENPVHEVIVSSIRSSVSYSLYMQLQAIYAPMLGGKQKDGENFLREPIDSLKTTLAKKLRKGGTNLKSQQFDEADTRGIFSPTDEIEVWQDNERENYGSVENEKLRKRAEIINTHFAKVSK